MLSAVINNCYALFVICYCANNTAHNNPMLSACYLRFAGQKFVVLAAHAPDCQSREMRLQEMILPDYWVREFEDAPTRPGRPPSLPDLRRVVASPWPCLKSYSTP